MSSHHFILWCSGFCKCPSWFFHVAKDFPFHLYFIDRWISSSTLHALRDNCNKTTTETTKLRHYESERDAIVRCDMHVHLSLNYDSSNPHQQYISKSKIMRIYSLSKKIRTRRKTMRWRSLKYSNKKTFISAWIRCITFCILVSLYFMYSKHFEVFKMLAFILCISYY